MTSITYSASYKRSLPNYEHVQVFFSLTDDVREGEHVDDAKNRVVAKVDQWVYDKIREVDEEAK